MASAMTFQHLARTQFGTEVDVNPTVDAIKSRRGDKIYAELKRLQDIVRGFEQSGDRTDTDIKA
jgi:hypothetical protein